MISTINSENIDILFDFCNKDDVIACDIYTGVKLAVYMPNNVWIGIKNSKPYCCIKRSLLGYLIYVDKDVYIDEISEFFEFMPNDNIMGDENIISLISEHIKGKVETSFVMKKTNYDIKIKNQDKIIHPKYFSDMYNILNGIFIKECKSNIKDDWIYSSSLKERRNIGKTVCIYDGQRCVSCGMIDAQNKKALIIASIATVKDYRGLGYASDIVNYLCEMARKLEKTAYVILRTKELESFYKKIGFVYERTWATIKVN